MEYFFSERHGIYVGDMQPGDRLATYNEIKDHNARNSTSSIMAYNDTVLKGLEDQIINAERKLMLQDTETRATDPLVSELRRLLQAFDLRKLFSFDIVYGSNMDDAASAAKLQAINDALVPVEGTPETPGVAYSNDEFNTIIANIKAMPDKTESEA